MKASDQTTMLKGEWAGQTRLFSGCGLTTLRLLAVPVTIQLLGRTGNIFSLKTLYTRSWKTISAFELVLSQILKDQEKYLCLKNFILSVLPSRVCS